jgi:hypothetical protein
MLADQLTEVLIEAGVERIYGGVGQMLQLARANLRNIPVIAQR